MTTREGHYDKMNFSLIKYTIVDRPGEHDHVAGWRNRCTYCGHRVGAVRQTRERPWRIPAEIVLRYLAMRHAAGDMTWPATGRRARFDLIAQGIAGGAEETAQQRMLAESLRDAGWAVVHDPEYDVLRAVAPHTYKADCSRPAHPCRCGQPADHEVHDTDTELDRLYALGLTPDNVASLAPPISEERGED